MKLVIDMKWMESKPPPVSIEDRPPLYDDTLNSVLLRWAWDDGGCWIGCCLRVLREFTVRGPSPGF